VLELAVEPGRSRRASGDTVWNDLLHSLEDGCVRGLAQPVSLEERVRQVYVELGGADEAALEPPKASVRAYPTTNLIESVFSHRRHRLRA
jgi:hypothetical protein